MSARGVIPLDYEVGAGATVIVEPYQVREAVIALRSVEAWCDSDPPSNVQLAILYGELQVYPSVGMVSLSTKRFVDKLDAQYYRGDKVRVKLKNLDTANARRVWGNIEYEVVE